MPSNAQYTKRVMARKEGKKKEKKSGLGLANAIADLFSPKDKKEKKHKIPSKGTYNQGRAKKIKEGFFK